VLFLQPIFILPKFKEVIDDPLTACHLADAVSVDNLLPAKIQKGD